MEWQPIETAPEAGGRVLVYNPVVGVYSTEYSKGEWPLRCWNGEPGTWFPRPTHWMPLPKPPEA